MTKQESRYEYESRLSNAIAYAVREAIKETGIKQFPESTIVLVSYWDELSNRDTICGWPVYVSNSLGGNEVKLAFKSKEESSYKLLKAFEDNFYM